MGTKKFVGFEWGLYVRSLGPVPGIGQARILA